jgi:hypothetical protein
MDGTSFQLNLSQSAMISYNLTLQQGMIALGTNTLTLSDTAIIDSGSKRSYVITNGTGRLVQNVKTIESFFPVGSSTTYNPVTIATDTSSDHFSVGVIPSVNPPSTDDSAAVQITYDISKFTTGNNGNVTMTVQWDGSSEGGQFVRNSAISWEYSGAWVPSGTVTGITGSNPYVATIIGVTSFGHYTLGNPGALPIQLAAINGTNIAAGVVRITWQTISETNTYGYYVERQDEGSKIWTTVSNLIAGSGTTLQPHTYSWTDMHALLPSYTYRLRVVTLNGATSFSQAITVSGILAVRSGAEPYVFKLSQNYPNPFNPTTTIQYSIKNPGHVTLIVYNVLGQEVTHLVDEQKAPGNYSIVFNAGNYASGEYFYRLISAGNVQVKKMVLVK